MAAWALVVAVEWSGLLPAAGTGLCAAGQRRGRRGRFRPPWQHTRDLSETVSRVTTGDSGLRRGAYTSCPPGRENLSSRE